MAMTFWRTFALWLAIGTAVSVAGLIASWPPRYLQNDLIASVVVVVGCAAFMGVFINDMAGRNGAEH